MCWRSEWFEVVFFVWLWCCVFGVWWGVGGSGYWLVCGVLGFVEVYYV